MVKTKAPRGSTRLAGIENQGATCFLNIIIQNLCLLPEFRDAILQLHPSELWGCPELKQIPIQLQRLFASLMLQNRKAVTSVALTNSLGWTREQVNQQQDAHEMLSILLPTLSSALIGTSAENIISRLMTVETVQSILCEGCFNTTEIEAKETTLFLQVKGIKEGLEEALHATFINSEILNGVNKFSCGICQGRRNALKTVKIQSAPQVLMIALNRVAYTADYTAYKVEDSFPFPLDIDLSTFTVDGQPHPDLEYELTGVIVHSGSGVTSGHYFTFIRDIDSLGFWEMDETVEMSPIKADIKDCNTPLETVATVLSGLLGKSESVTIDNLSFEIAKQTGKPWSKSHRQTHGPFPKFLKANPSTFVVEGNSVRLTETLCPVSSPSSPPPEQVSRPGHNWFLFNDEEVSPAAPGDLQKVFGGKESAYMLLYRRRHSPRPSEAFDNPAYNVPCHLLQEMQIHNLEEE